MQAASIVVWTPRGLRDLGALGNTHLPRYEPAYLPPRGSGWSFSSRGPSFA